MATAEVGHRDRPQEEEPLPGRRAIHRPVEGLTMEELLRTAAKNTGNSTWAETLQPLSTFENNIASRLSAQTMEGREGHQGSCPPARSSPENLSQYPQASQQQRDWGRDEEYQNRQPRNWSDPSQPPGDPYTYLSPISALAALGGPAAKNLARMIEASQGQGTYAADQPSSQSRAIQPGTPPHPGAAMQRPQQLLPFFEQQPMSQQAFEAAQQLQMQGFGGYPPQGVDPARWAVARGPRPQARAFDVYQPPPQLSEAAQTELFRSLQMLQEAQRLSALASSQIQDAYDSAGQGSNARKRKLTEVSNALTQQIGEVLAEGHDFPEKPAAQVCSICGITQTPVWRRLNKALVCNACGLKRRRSANIGRQGNNSQKKNEDAQTAREGVSGDKATYEQCAKLEGA